MQDFLDQGMDPGEINAMRKARKNQDFEVWPENWPAVEMFLRCQTQWRTTMAGVCGLDYAAVQWLFRLYEVKDQPAVLESLQVMEAMAIRILNKGAK